MNVTKGYLCVMAAAVLWSSSAAAGKYLFSTGMTPFDLVQIRVTFSAIVLTAVHVAARRDLFRIGVRHLGYAAATGIAMALTQVSYFSAIKEIQVAAAILLQYLSPVLVASFSMIFWKERPSLTKMAALLLAMSGSYLVVGGYNLQLLRLNAVGIVWGVISAVSFASYTLLGEWGIRRYSPWTILYYALLLAAVYWNLFYHPLYYLEASYTAVQWAWLLYIAVMGTAVPFGLYFVGISYIRATRAVITSTMEPIAAAFMAFVFLGETLQFLQISGGILVLVAIIILQRHREYDVLTPEFIRAGTVPPPP